MGNPRKELQWRLYMGTMNSYVMCFFPKPSNLRAEESESRSVGTQRDSACRLEVLSGIQGVEFRCLAGSNLPVHCGQTAETLPPSPSSPFWSLRGFSFHAIPKPKKPKLPKPQTLNQRRSMLRFNPCQGSWLDQLPRWDEGLVLSC